jgi:Flp pilus assembly protein TadD
VLFVGLDGADWQLLDDYMARGAMPNLAALVREGARGALESEHPPLSPLLWNTMMTGVSPLEHGILDFSRFQPGSGVREPITSDERRAPAIWNLATWAGKRAAIFGLWATYPAEPVSGILVSDRLFGFLNTQGMPEAGVVYPPAQESWARQALAAAEREIDLAALREYLPWLTAADYAARLRDLNPYAHPVSALRRILVETAVYHRLVTEHLRAERPDLTIVYLQGTDSIGHVFAPYAPPRQTAISPQEYERYHRVPELYFRHVDRLLGEYRQLAAERDAVLFLASDHGFLWKEGRPTELSSFANTTAAKWHRKEGMYVLWGPEIAAARGELGGGIRQVAATLAAIFGLPTGRGLAGPPLPPIAAPAGEPVDYQAWFASRPAPAARLAPADSAAAQEELAKLRALGYIGAGEPASAPEAARGSTRTAGSYNNEALILQDLGRDADARAAYEKAVELDPNLASALWNLSDLLHTEKGDLERSDKLLLRALANRLPEGPKYVVGRAIGYQRAGQIERSLRLLDGAVQAQPEVADFWLFRGRYRVERRDCAPAVADFAAAIRLDPANAAAHTASGLAKVCAGDRAGARADFRRSLELDPKQPQVRRFLAELGG